MTKDELKKKLHAYRDLEEERKQLLEQYTALADPRGANMDGMPKGPGAGDPLAGIATKRQALAKRYAEKVEELADAQTAIEDMIEGLDPLARRLMRHRYIDGLPWEEVCVAIGYSWRRTHDLHAKALLDLLAAETEKEGANV